MIKILLGGSPCTHWSIAQKNDRETQPNSGLGWELFLNYKIALEEMGCNVVRYYATEIDEYAIKTTQHNFPNTIQLGDAFQVRDDTWQLRK